MATIFWVAIGSLALVVEVFYLLTNTAGTLTMQSRGGILRKAPFRVAIGGLLPWAAYHLFIDPDGAWNRPVDFVIFAAGAYLLGWRTRNRHKHP